MWAGAVELLRERIENGACPEVDSSGDEDEDGEEPVPVVDDDSDDAPDELGGALEPAMELASGDLHAIVEQGATQDRPGLVQRGRPARPAIHGRHGIHGPLPVVGFLRVVEDDPRQCIASPVVHRLEQCVDDDLVVRVELSLERPPQCGLDGERGLVVDVLLERIPGRLPGRPGDLVQRRRPDGVAEPAGRCLEFRPYTGIVIFTVVTG